MIEAPHFVAGAEIEDRLVARSAPIIAYMRGWDGRQVQLYCRKKSWILTAYIDDSEIPPPLLLQA